MQRHRDLIEQLITATIPLLQREYPNGLMLWLNEKPKRNITPKELHPTFYGCFDWHSSVHSHWQLLRAIRLLPRASFVGDGLALLNEHLSKEKLKRELAYLEKRPSFEMPYGMAWLLQLCAELREWENKRGAAWLKNLAGLEAHAIRQFERYCQRLAFPVRTGLHNQTAFSLGLAWDYAKTAEQEALLTTINEAAIRLYGDDADAPLAFEPSASDFLSPALSEADLMRRVLSQNEFVAWLERFLPNGANALTPVTVMDHSDGRLAHFAGLNISRAWMLATIAASLPREHPQREECEASSMAHEAAGLIDATHEDYMISHWVPSFAIYLVTWRGMPDQ